MATLEYLKNEVPQNISINIGTGKGTSILEVIKNFQAIKEYLSIMNLLKED